jgi:hypothetical protein
MVTKIRGYAVVESRHALCTGDRRILPSFCAQRRERAYLE